MTGPDPVATVTVRGADGGVVGTVTIEADGSVTPRVTDPSGADRVRRVAEHLGRPRAPRPRPDCC